LLWHASRLEVHLGDSSRSSEQQQQQQQQHCQASTPTCSLLHRSTLWQHKHIPAGHSTPHGPAGYPTPPPLLLTRSWSR
jgi:hypothetical protein